MGDVDNVLIVCSGDKIVLKNFNDSDKRSG